MTWIREAPDDNLRRFLELLQVLHQRVSKYVIIRVQLLHQVMMHHRKQRAWRASYCGRATGLHRTG